MGDESTRVLERQLARDGDPATEARLVAARWRIAAPCLTCEGRGRIPTGALPALASSAIPDHGEWCWSCKGNGSPYRQRVRVAAALGDAVALEVCGSTFAVDPSGAVTEQRARVLVSQANAEMVFAIGAAMAEQEGRPEARGPIAIFVEGLADRHNGDGWAHARARLRGWLLHGVKPDGLVWLGLRVGEATVLGHRERNARVSLMGTAEAFTLPSGCDGWHRGEVGALVAPTEGCPWNLTHHHHDARCTAWVTP